MFFPYEEICLDNLIVPFLLDLSILLLIWTSISSVIEELFLDLMYLFCVDGTHLKVNLFYFSLLKVCLVDLKKPQTLSFHIFSAASSCLSEELVF